MCGTLSSNKSTPAVITSSITDETKKGTTVLGKDSLKESSAAQHLVAVAHGDM
jgi:hypothetical protein